MRFTPLLLLLGSCAPAGVAGLAPDGTLEWEPFPPAGLADLEGREVTDVVYDLKVFWGSLLIYEGTGLAEPRHRLQVDIKPERPLTWTVRARFRLDGRPRWTQWGALAGRSSSPK